MQGGSLSFRDPPLGAGLCFVVCSQTVTRLRIQDPRRHHHLFNCVLQLILRSPPFFCGWLIVYQKNVVVVNGAASPFYALRRTSGAITLPFDGIRLKSTGHRTYCRSAFGYDGKGAQGRRPAPDDHRLRFGLNPLRPTVSERFTQKSKRVYPFVKKG